MKNLIIGRADKLVSEDSFLVGIKKMIKESIQNDPTLVMHEDSILIERYKCSIIAILNGLIIGNTSIYPTSMKPLNNINIEGKNIYIGECGSTVIDLNNRQKGLGKILVTEAVNTIGNKNDLLIAATINPYMVQIRKQLGYVESIFPRQYYNEGLKYLSPKLNGGENEFIRRAKFLVKYNSYEYKNIILDLLKKDNEG